MSVATGKKQQQFTFFKPFRLVSTLLNKSATLTQQKISKDPKQDYTDMGLLQNIYRQVVITGQIPRVIRFLPYLSKILIFVSVVLLAILPMEGQFRHTYISENALLPSQAYSYFRESEWNILRGYRAQIELFAESENNLTISERNKVVDGWLKEFGLRTSVYRSEGTNYETLYGVLHAPRGDGTEAIVLAIPWNNVDGLFNIGGAALGVSMIRYFSRWPIWSKNIIVVFVENPGPALRSWVEAYHTSLDLTGGSLEAAVVLDYPGNNDMFDYSEIHYAGLNGELPNLDLVNIAVAITQHEGIQVSLNSFPKWELDLYSFSTRLKTLLLGIKNSALAGATKVYGNEAFSGWRIQAVTLKAIGDDGNSDITTFGRVAEAVFRSVNNLLEKFHQSFFFYLLLAPRDFVSISSYLPSAVLISVSYAISSLSNLFTDPDAGATSFFSSESLSAALIWSSLLIISALVAQLTIYSPQPAFLIAVSIALCSLSLRESKYLPRLKGPLTYRLRVFAYLYCSLALTSLLLVNFPLALGIGLLAYPMTFVNSYNPRQSLELVRRQKLRNLFCLLLSNPFISTLIFCNLFEPQLRGFGAIYGLVAAWRNIGVWTWYAICIGWLPSWLLVAISSFPSTPDLLPADREKRMV